MDQVAFEFMNLAAGKLSRVILDCQHLVRLREISDFVRSATWDVSEVFVRCENIADEWSITDLPPWASEMLDRRPEKMGLVYRVIDSPPEAHHVNDAVIVCVTKELIFWCFIAHEARFPRIMLTRELLMDFQDLLPTSETERMAGLTDLEFRMENLVVDEQAIVPPKRKKKS